MNPNAIRTGTGSGLGVTKPSSSPHTSSTPTSPSATVAVARPCLAMTIDQWHYYDREWEEHRPLGLAGRLVGSTPQIDIDPSDDDKPTVIALREIAAGKVGLEMLNRGQA